MIAKIAILARDNPIKFFLLGFLFLFTLIFASILCLSAVIKLVPDNTSNNLEIALVAAIFLPVLPVFFSLFLLLAERYLNFFKVGWVFGLQSNPFLRKFLRWADVPQEKQEI